MRSFEKLIKSDGVIRRPSNAGASNSLNLDSKEDEEDEEETLAF